MTTKYLKKTKVFVTYKINMYFSKAPKKKKMHFKLKSTSSIIIKCIHYIIVRIKIILLSHVIHVFIFYFMYLRLNA